MELRDIYKLAHQSVFGPEHLGEYMSEEAILEEMRSPKSDITEPLLEPIALRFSSCRINLRTAARMDIAPVRIAKALHASITHFSRSRTKFLRLWMDVGIVLERIEEIFPPDEFKTFTSTMSEKEFPPLHHSASYRRHNRPAYRVLAREGLRCIMPLSSIGDLSL